MYGIKLDGSWYATGYKTFTEAYGAQSCWKLTDYGVVSIERCDD